MPLTTQATDLIISAASSLTNALGALSPLFENTHPHVRLQFNFGASDVLVRQIAAGAPVDVLATADAETMDKAVNKHLVDAATRRDFARNTLVVIQPRDSAPLLAGLASLGAARVKRVALGNPASVPAGRYARDALERAALWPLPQDKAVFTQSVRQALDYVARGEVDAGLVYATDVAVRADQVRVAFALPANWPITYPVAVVAGTRQADLAAAYVAWLLSAHAQAQLARHGFQAP